MTLRIDLEKLKSVLICGLLFFAAMNFYAKFFYFVFAVFLVLLVIQTKVVVNQRTLLYLALGVLMALYNAREGLLSMLRCFAYVFLYVVGYNMIMLGPAKTKDRGNLQRMAFAMLVSICAGSFAHYLLNFAINVGEVLGRNTTDIWSGSAMSATGQATLACLMLGLSVAMFFLPVKKSHRYVGVACIVAALAYNLILAGRTMLAVLLILLAVGIVYVYRESRSSLERLKISLGISVSVLGVALIFLYNVGGIRDYVMDSLLFERFGASFESIMEDSSRMNRKLAFLANGWKYPLGGLHLREEFGYAHGLLLDGYDEYGIMGLLLLTAILVLGIRSLIKLLRTDCSRELKLALLCVYCAMLLVFCVEPILAGMAWLYACYSLINGVLDAMNESWRQIEA